MTPFLLYYSVSRIKTETEFILFSRSRLVLISVHLSSRRQFITTSITANQSIQVCLLMTQMNRIVENCSAITM